MLGDDLEEFGRAQGHEFTPTPVTPRPRIVPAHGELAPLRSDDHLQARRVQGHVVRGAAWKERGERGGSWSVTSMSSGEGVLRNASDK